LDEPFDVGSRGLGQQAETAVRVFGQRVGGLIEDGRGRTERVGVG
jgi:hypothetical protein